MRSTPSTNASKALATAAWCAWMLAAATFLFGVPRLTEIMNDFDVKLPSLTVMLIDGRMAFGRLEQSIPIVPPEFVTSLMALVAATVLAIAVVLLRRSRMSLWLMFAGGLMLFAMQAAVLLFPLLTMWDSVS